MLLSRSFFNPSVTYLAREKCRFRCNTIVAVAVALSLEYKCSLNVFNFCVQESYLI